MKKLTPKAGYLYIVGHADRPGEIMLGEIEDLATLFLKFPAIDGWGVFETAHYDDVSTALSKAKKKLQRVERNSPVLAKGSSLLPNQVRQGHVYIVTHVDRIGQAKVGATHDVATLALQFPSADGWVVNRVRYFDDAAAGVVETMKQVERGEMGPPTQTCH
jgi:hypothetical protein